VSAARALGDAQLQALLDEDAPCGDLSTAALGLAAEPGQAEFRARGAMVAAATEEAARLFELCGCRVHQHLPSGTQVQAGGLLLSAQGPAEGLLLAWKVAQNLVEFAAGIASATAAIVGTLRAAGCMQPVAATRKNVPGTRALSAKAVRAGGGTMHRLGLSGSLLVFPEHRGFIAPADLPRRLAALRQQQPEKKLVAEAGDLAQALELARMGVEVLQLERFLPQAVAELRTRLSQQGLAVLLAPAGGITLANAVDYARAGADVIVTSAPYVAPPRDVRVSISPG
jgi:molybdenum transport protein